MTNPEYRTRDDERDDDEHGSSLEWDAASDHALRCLIREKHHRRRRVWHRAIIDSEHATPLNGMPRSINHAKRNEPNLQAAQGQTTSHSAATAGRNGKPRDDHGKPEWRATRRPPQAGMASHATPRQAGMASQTTATASRNGKPDDDHGKP